MNHFVTIFDARDLQVSNWSFLIIPFLMVSGIVLTILTMRKRKKDGFVSEDGDGSGRQANHLGFAAIVVAGVTLFTGIATVANIADMVTVRDAFNRHQYRVVSGTVEQFDPMAFAGHRAESFVVSGVKFSYADSHLTAGFHHSAVMGGPIHGGEYVRIAYTCPAGEEVAGGGCYYPLIIRMEMRTAR